MSEFKLKISTDIHSPDYDDRIDVTYPCRYSCENGVYRLKYTDDEAGFTVIKLTSDGEIIIRRQNSFMIVLREGYLHTADSETPYGTIPMQFTARKITCQLGEQGGKVEYIADMVVGGAEQTNTVVMEIFEEV